MEVLSSLQITLHVRFVALQVIFLPKSLHWMMVQTMVMVMVTVLELMWILFHLLNPLILIPNYHPMHQQKQF